MYWILIVMMFSGFPLSILGGCIYKKDTLRETAGLAMILVATVFSMLGFFIASQALRFDQAFVLPSCVLLGMIVAGVGLVIGELK